MTHDPARIRLFLLGAALTIAAAAGPTTVRAQDGLLDQGGSLLKGVLQGQSGGSSLSDAEVGDGLREALRVGAERVTSTLGQVDGFNTNPDVHIPLPASLETVQSALAMVGMSSVADDLELRMNRAAEAAVPQAKELFWQAVSEMTLEDAQGILSGPDDAAPRYFPGQDDRSRSPSASRRWSIESSPTPARSSPYDQMMGDYRELPFAPDVRGQPHALRRRSRRWTACS